MSDTPPPPSKRGRGRPPVGPGKHIRYRPDQVAAIKAIAKEEDADVSQIYRDLIDEALAARTRKDQP